MTYIISETNMSQDTSVWSVVTDSSLIHVPAPAKANKYTRLGKTNTNFLEFQVMSC